MNIALILSYDGTAYHGWQVQKNGSSIQQTLTEAVNKLLGCDTYVSGVGRTDAGVHARRYVANFKARARFRWTGFRSRSMHSCPMILRFLRQSRCRRTLTRAFAAQKRNMPIMYIRPKCLTRFWRGGHTGTAMRSMWRKCRRAQRFVGKQDFAAVRSVGTPSSQPCGRFSTARLKPAMRRPLPRSATHA